jgi:hypothetical protein
MGQELLFLIGVPVFQSQCNPLDLRDHLTRW